MIIIVPIQMLERQMYWGQMPHLPQRPEIQWLIILFSAGHPMLPFQTHPRMLRNDKKLFDATTRDAHHFCEIPPSAESGGHNSGIEQRGGKSWLSRIDLSRIIHDDSVFSGKSTI